MLAACAVPFAPTAQADIRILPVPELPCDLPVSSGLIIWQHAPGVPDRSRFANPADLYNCRPTLDTWRAGEPTGPGYCSKIAWSADNPGYVPSVTPAAPLKKVIDQVGDCS
ncbi:hypothetical protein BHQ23_00475 [Mycobacterium gordonae]|uniref:Uncharacterized protein n=1 Tax=Mycobacterium gordonae TaxID=1778 RepID=A0A1A6B6W6_MYCGO|nr:hypothetical protein A9W98_04230 [Mycobacterium gordonae]ODR24512.1 hypothetical protein BHQ23_00475 [Mycobacterium gordonae]ORV78751.1 hypothetical protein AWC08_31515 [Mycobacterium gordonae]PJE05248.1 MAG: hypothetical protein CK428_26960 [Mycobacterium sp.]